MTTEWFGGCPHDLGSRPSGPRWKRDRNRPQRLGAEDGGCHAWGIPRIVNGLYPQLYVEYPIYMDCKPLTKWHAHPCGDEFRESICGPLVDHGHIPLCSQSNHLYFCSLYPAKCPCLAACLIPKCRWWPPKKRLMVLKWLTINWGNYEG